MRATTAAAPMPGARPASTIAQRLAIVLLTVAASSLLPACALLPAGPPRDAVAVLRAGPPPLVPGAAPFLPASAAQTLHAAFGDQGVTLACGLSSSTARGWRIACVNPLGLRVLTLGVDSGGAVTAERGPQVPASLYPARVLADVQLALWPLAALEAAYASSPWQVEEPYAGTRRLLLNGRLVAEVHAAPGAPWRGPLWLSNLALGYTLGLVPEADEGVESAAPPPTR